MIKGLLNYAAEGSPKVSDKEQIGIGGFLAEVRMNDRITFSSSVPTAYVEDGSFINDHIINDPISIDISGEISDVIVRPEPYLEAYRSAIGTISEFTEYLPGRTATQLTKINGYLSSANDIVERVDEVFDDIGQVLNLLNGEETEGISNQQDFVEFIKAIYNTKQLINIETQLGVYENMRITSLTLDKSDKSYISYSMTLQEIRFAKTKIVGVEKYFSNPVAGGQTDPKVSKGSVPGEEVEKSFLSTLFG